jgi:hypothetical protein
MYRKYTVYAEKDDITFIMEERSVNNKTQISVVGFYFGEPNEEYTTEFANTLTAEFE